MMRCLVGMAVVGGLALNAAAGPDRVLRTEAVIDATPAQLWEVYTTKAGWESWAVPLAEVDFRVGGTIRTNYNKDAGIGGAGTITHHILAIEPERLVVTRFDAPANAGWAKIAEACQVIVRLEPVSPTRTRFVETMVGWSEGPEWDESYDHFKKGNEWTMERLKKKFPAPASDPDATLALLRSMVGGEWVCESKSPDGALFRVRNLIELAPDGKGITGRGWLGDASGMFPHGATQVWREGHEVLFQSLDQDGGIARGTIRATGDRTLTWDWNQAASDGSARAFTVTQTFDGPDTYRMRLTLADAGGGTKELVNILLHRVSPTPPEFLRLRGAVPAKETSMAAVDCSLFPASGMVANPLIKETIVKATPDEAFRAWSTPDGLKFLVDDCNVDLRIGGPYELYFGGRDVPQDQRGSNGCQVLSYIPGGMLSFTWNAPPKFPDERAHRAWVVITFTATEPGRTKVRLVHTGFGQGGHWPEVRDYFDRAWTNVLKAMTEHYDKALTPH